MSCELISRTAVWAGPNSSQDLQDLGESNKETKRIKA